MDIQVVNSLISSVGVPIFVAVWMLYKTSQDSKETRDTLNDLKVVIQSLTDKLDNHLDREEKSNDKR